MTDPTQRVLRLLGLLQSRPVWTGPELATRLGVTTRSIRRDVERLRTLGYPVNATQGSGGGYQLGAGRALPPLLLDDEEVIATAVSLRLAAGGTVAGASEAAVRTLAKLDQVLPARLRAQVRTLHDSITTLAGDQVTVDADALMTLARACRDAVRTEFGYLDRDGAATRRRVEPYQLVATGRRWYLLGWDMERGDWRTFRLDRVRDPVASTWRFARRDHPDPAAHVQRAVTSSTYRHQAKILLHLPAAVARERVPPTVGAVEAVDPETCVLSTGADSLSALAFHVGLLDCDFEVLAPPELADTVAVLGRRFAAAARGR
jgi:predicted DNA-binding transcriptional regulator YafY